MTTKTKITILSIAAITAAGLVYYFTRGKSSGLHPLVLPSLMRGCNGTGCGAFGESRDKGKREHNGIDFLADPGATVYAPFDGRVSRSTLNVYSDYNKRALKGFEIIADNGDLMKVFYVTTHLKNGDRISRGQKIGVVQNMKQYYSSDMPNHVHGEIHRNGVVVNYIDEINPIA